MLNDLGESEEFLDRFLNDSRTELQRGFQHVSASDMSKMEVSPGPAFADGGSADYCLRLFFIVPFPSPCAEQSCLSTIGDTKSMLQQTLQRGLRRLVESVVLPRIKAAIELLPLSAYHYSEVRTLET